MTEVVVDTTSNLVPNNPLQPYLCVKLIGSTETPNKKAWKKDVRYCN